MMISITLCCSAIHAADHLPDLELDPCAAAAAHRWGHPEDRAAACPVDRAREGSGGSSRERIPPGRRRIRILGHEDIPLGWEDQDQCPC
jgi:hypothetical protein